MFEFIKNNDRGQVGIGTLIVFIAMVLVAAIAAGVLINTAGFLQSQAEATGQESTDLVSERIDVTSTVGIVESNSNPENLVAIRVSVAGAAGADQIDLTKTTIQAVGPNGQANLVFNNTVSGGGSQVTSATEIQDGNFGVQDSTGTFVSAENAVLNSDNRFTLVFNPENDPFGSTSGSAIFGESDSSSLDIVSPSGATTSVELRAPDLFTSSGEAVRL
jgi:flagellin FlaB